jgi:glycosyltransferase involved in cell wall biosynthesis
MKVLYDHQAFTGSRFGGVARYFHDLMEALAAMDVDVNLALKFSNNEYLKESSLTKPWTYNYFLGFMPTSMLVSQINRFASILALKKQDFDIFHPTFFHPYFLDHLQDKPFVLTYHDLIKEKLNLSHLDNGTLETKQLLLNKASKVIAISENTKADILSYFDINPDKITVVYHSSTFNSMETHIDNSLKLPEEYLLYVGTRNYYKNFDNLIASLIPIFKKKPSLKLICAGGGNFNEL